MELVDFIIFVSGIILFGLNLISILTFCMLIRGESGAS